MEKYYLENNGFKINKNFHETKKDFVSRINKNSEYFYELFEYKKLFYVIPISKKIMEKSSFFKVMYDDLDFDSPIFGSNFVPECSENIVDGFFDVNFFIKTIIKIFVYISEQDYYSEMLSSVDINTIKSLRRSEMIFIDELCPVNSLPQIFFNTHEALYGFFHKLDLSVQNEKGEMKNPGLMFLGKMIHFAECEKFPEKFYINYFGFKEGTYVNKYHRIFEKRISTSSGIPIDRIGAVVNDEGTIGVDDVFELKNNQGELHDHIGYLVFAFMYLPFTISHHVLIKSDTTDKFLWIYKKFCIMDGHYFLGFPEFPPHDYPKNVCVVGFERLGDEKNLYQLKNGQNLEFKSSIFTGDNFLNAAQYVSSIKFDNSLIEIGNKFMSYSRSLREMIVPNSVKVIGDDFLVFSAVLVTVIIPNTLPEIKNGFLNFCKKLKTFLIPRSVRKIGNAFLLACREIEEMTVPDSVVSVGEKFMTGCESLRKITISNSIRAIPMGFLSLCSSLKKITIPESVESLGSVFMSDCISLENITIPKGVKDIGSGFLLSCGGLRKISMLCSLLEVHEHFMNNCSSLEEITLSIRDDGIIHNYFMKGCENLESVTITGPLKKIKTSFLDGCGKVKNISLPDSIEYIGPLFMLDCDELEEFTTPTSLKNIEFGFLNNCKKLKKVTISRPIPNIGEIFLKGCANLEEVIVPSKGSYDLPKQARITIADE
jgi:hypothetical protein